MVKSNKFWMRGSVSAVSLLILAGTVPAKAQDANTGLLGSIGGLRTVLGNYGIAFGLNDSENLLSNLSGGVKNGTTMQGVTTMTVDVDTGKAFGLPGGIFHTSALQIHGSSISGPYLDNLQGANGNEGQNSTRLWELWYDQQFLNNSLDIKIGQQSVDNEYMISTYSGLFVNTMAGWPLIPSDDLYGGGPAYPLSAPGVRLRAEPNGNVTILAGVYDDNPGGGRFSSNAQQLDPSGTNFNLNTGALWMAEIQVATRMGGLAGKVKFGGWYDSGTGFLDQRFDTNGVPLAGSASNGNPETHKGNYSLYGVADQTVWQSKADPARSLNVFGRIMGAPSNRNLVSFFVNGGVTLAAPLPGRENDNAGIDFGLGKVSREAADADQDAGLAPRSTEELIELTYQAQANSWLILQPDMQFIVNPGGGTPDPNDPTHNLRNEFVAGIRAIVTF